jgi:hypothetical protein
MKSIDLNLLIEKKEKRLIRLIDQLRIEVKFHPSEREEDSYFEAINDKLNLNCFGRTKEKAIDSLKLLMLSSVIMEMEISNKKVGESK